MTYFTSRLPDQGYFCRKGSEIAFEDSVYRRLKDRDRNYTLAGKMNVISNVMLLGLFVIGLLAATTGVISATAVSWTGFGVGAGVFGAHLIGGNLKNRKIDLLTKAVFTGTLMLMGILGGAGALSATQVGYSFIGIVGGYSLLYCFGCHASAVYRLTTREVKGND